VSDQRRQELPIQTGTDVARHPDNIKSIQ